MLRRHVLFLSILCSCFSFQYVCAGDSFQTWMKSQKKWNVNLESNALQPINASLITNADIRALISFNQINEVYLMSVNVPMSYEKLRGLKNWENESALDELIIKDCDAITDESMSHLSKLQNLKTLAIGYYGYRWTISDNGLKFLSKSPALEVLYIPNAANITDEGLGHIASIKTLKHLHLFGNMDKITVAGIKRLTALTNLETLQLVDFKLITDVSVEHIASISSLKELDLWGCDLITDVGVDMLARLEKLESLSLKYCDQLTDQSLRSIAKISTLKRLDLEGCEKITSAGITEISKISGLENLNINGCFLVYDDGAKTLINLKSLQALSIERCHNISYLTTEPMKNELPNIMIKER